MRAEKWEPLFLIQLKDVAHFVCGRHFERLEGGNPSAPLKASHRQNGLRQHHNLNCPQALGEAVPMRHK